MIVRPERPADIPAITLLTEQAFGRPDEARLILRLRADGDAVLSLVAEDEGGALLGHVLFSAMAAPFRALGLAPVSVVPARQRQGLGRMLIEQGIAEAQAASYEAIFVLGDPAYYGRFGFRADLAAGFESPYAGPYLMVLPLKGELPARTGKVEYAPAFAGL